MKTSLREAMQRLLASHRDYTQSQARGWPDNPAGYPNHEWSVEIEEKAVAAIDALQRQGWQPIATAPRDGTYILACDDDSHAVVYWPAGADAGWVYAWHEYDGPLMMHSATYWQPLPQPPTGEQTP